MTHTASRDSLRKREEERWRIYQAFPKYFIDCSYRNKYVLVLIRLNNELLGMIGYKQCGHLFETSTPVNKTYMHIHMR